MVEASLRAFVRASCAPVSRVAQRIQADASGLHKLGCEGRKRPLIRLFRLVNSDGAYRDRTGDLRLAKPIWQRAERVTSRHDFAALSKDGLAQAA
jgi:hypothetical protein